MKVKWSYVQSSVLAYVMLELRLSVMENSSLLIGVNRYFCRAVIEPDYTADS